MHQISASGQGRRMTIINESGLYSLILSSKLPTAKKFKHWVTKEVLPTIHYIKDMTGLEAENSVLKIEVSDFFLDSTYKNERGKTYPCYQMTRLTY